jgi:death-on-curing protein
LRIHKSNYSIRHRGWSYPTPDFVYYAHDLALELYGGNPGFKDGERGRGLVDSAVAAPFRAMEGVELYSTHFEKVAALGYLIASNHGFLDANKRTASIVVGQTLGWNDHTLRWSDETESMIYRLIGFGELHVRGFKFALLDACGYDATDADTFNNT